MPLRLACVTATARPSSNSVNGKTEVLDTILPIVKKYGAAVVGLTMDENGIPPERPGALRHRPAVLTAAQRYGIPKEDVIIDCLTLTVSAQQDQAKETLEAVRRVTQELGLHTMLGVSNISFGLPERIRITENFLVQALYCGLDLPILNPNQRQIMDAVATFGFSPGRTWTAPPTSTGSPTRSPLPPLPPPPPSWIWRRLWPGA